MKFICDDGNHKSVIKSIFELITIIAEKFDFILIMPVLLLLASISLTSQINFLLC
jgi:hypothetical protein